MASKSKLELTPSSELSSRYTLKEFLGEGQYGTVWRCEKRATGEHFALKYIDLTKCSSRARRAALGEVEILQKIRDSGFSDSVVSLSDVYGDKDSLYLVMELCTGGDLLELIQKRPGAFLSEAESHHVFMSLADFGLAVDVPWWQQIRGYAGSKPYEAPEVMAGIAYDESADIWSLGVTLYAMLSGKWPLFRGGKRVLDDKVDFASDDWKDLIRRMLRVDVNERFTIDEVLAHPWVRPAVVAAAAQEEMETVDLSEKLTAVVVSRTDANITSGIAEADSESTATSAAIFASEAKSTVSTAFKSHATTHVPDTKRSDTTGSMSLASATNSTDSDCGSNAGKPRWGGKLSPRTVLHRVMKAFSPLTRQKEASCIPIEVL
ncbi:unnamed protein product [Closterium sp. Yama58-4]|nr:unnamed protein product [Closterium sp. Yama58-4]